MGPKTVVAFTVVITFVAGCSKNSTSPATNSPATTTSPVASGIISSGPQTSGDPIRSAIQAHLAHRGNLNLQSFDTDLKNVSVQGDHAQAEVEFHVKGGPGTMQLTYQLEKRDNIWSVVESVPATSNFSHPPLDGSSATTGNSASPPSGPVSDPIQLFRNATSAQPARRP